MPAEEHDESPFVVRARQATTQGIRLVLSLEADGVVVLGYPVNHTAGSIADVNLPRRCDKKTYSASTREERFMSILDVFGHGVPTSRKAVAQVLVVKDAVGWDVPEAPAFR